MGLEKLKHYIAQTQQKFSPAEHALFKEVVADYEEKHGVVTAMNEITAAAKDLESMQKLVNEKGQELHQKQIYFSNNFSKKTPETGTESGLTKVE